MIKARGGVANSGKTDNQGSLALLRACCILARLEYSGANLATTATLKLSVDQLGSANVGLGIS